MTSSFSNHGRLERAPADTGVKPSGARADDPDATWKVFLVQDSLPTLSQVCRHISTCGSIKLHWWGAPVCLTCSIPPLGYPLRAAMSSSDLAPGVILASSISSADNQPPSLYAPSRPPIALPTSPRQRRHQISPAQCQPPTAKVENRRGVCLPIYRPLKRHTGRVLNGIDFFRGSPIV